EVDDEVVAASPGEDGVHGADGEAGREDAAVAARGDELALLDGLRLGHVLHQQPVVLDAVPPHDAVLLERVDGGGDGELGALVRHHEGVALAGEDDLPDVPAIVHHRNHDAYANRRAGAAGVQVMLPLDVLGGTT